MNKYSYITLLTNDSYAYGVALLVESMSKVNTYYPLHVLITEGVHEATREFLNQLGVTYQEVPIIETPPDIYQHNMHYEPNTASTWRNCWTKLHIFNQTQFDKIVFLDADIMVLKNLDHLFNCPHMTSCLDGEYFNIWPGWDHFNSGCLVIEPSIELYNKILDFANSLTEDNIPEYIIADQEILNLYFKDWPAQTQLHLNKYYDIFPPYIQEYQISDIEENCYFLHYVGRKPWTFWIRTKQDQYAEYFYTKGREMVEARISKLDWSKIQSKLILTVYAICKNEVENVSKWLNSFGEADHVCVLDTGSTDGTWKLLQEKQKEFPNLIISQETIAPWRFDKARNISMTLIPKDTTIFFMADLDEVIKEPGWCDIVKSTWTPLFDRGQYTYNRDVAPNDDIIRTIPEYRIHSDDWYKWVNIVHEAIINHAGRKQFYVETCTNIPITVWHYPKAEKERDYAALCEDTLEEEPIDYVMQLQLAIEYEIRDEKEKALKVYQKLLKEPGNLQNFELARCFCSVGKLIYAIDKDLSKAFAYFREGRLIAPEVIDNYLAAAEIYYNVKMYQQALTLAKSGLHQAKTARWCTTYDPHSYYPYWLIGMSYYFLGDKIRGLGFMEVAESKYKIDSISSLCSAMIKEIAADPQSALKERNY